MRVGEANNSYIRVASNRATTTTTNVPTNRKNGFPWITRAQVALLIQLSPKQFDDAIKPRLQAAAKTGAGAKLRYNASAVVAELVAYRIEQAVEAAGGDPDLLGAGDSPAKEELLKVKLERERIKLKIDQRAVVPLADMRSGLAELFAGLRRASESILGRWGREPADVLNREIDTTVQRWNEMAAIDRAVADGDERDQPGTTDVGDDADPAAEAPQPD